MLADRLITLGKKNTEASKRSALAIFYVCQSSFARDCCVFQLTAMSLIQEPHSLLPKLFGPLRERYADRPGGYTRVLRIEPLKEDQAASAILELVDGPKDMRFAMTARTIAKLRNDGKNINDMTAGIIAKVTRFRKNGENDLEKMIGRFERLTASGDVGVGDESVRKQRVYPKLQESR